MIWILTLAIGASTEPLGVEASSPLPPPVAPVYSRLKDLHLTTDLVKEGKPAIRIVAPASGLYERPASRLRQTIEDLARVRVPIVPDNAPDAAVPIEGSLIVLGNRSTHQGIRELYNRFFCLTDLRYPGVGGYELRTLHNPFGNGHNIILCGGSDPGGVEAAVDALIARLKRAEAHNGSLAIGWLMEIQLGHGIAVPKRVTEMETWEASAGYGSSGYFGWNMISKRMAAYYMTGDPFHAREALRLAFPNPQAIRELADIDGEMIENKSDPLAGPYHYNAHLMVLFWDLIEESPVFSDEERLRVINAFARQLDHRLSEGVYGLTQPLPALGSRHGQWSAIALYCLGRYFHRDDPNPVWAQCLRGSQLAFASLHQHAWIEGESDNLFWYCTGIAPVFTHMLLTGDRAPMQNGVAVALLRAQEVLVSGRAPDWALRSAALDYLHKAAFLTQDGRWLTYRDRTGVKTGVFRLGQSFWPEDRLQPVLPADLAGQWTVTSMPKPHWLSRRNGFPLEESFYNASFRSAPDARGDYILLDGFNGASRNPYHAFAILELRLRGNTILQGYLNQVQIKADGMVEPQVAMDGALRRRDVLGQTALAMGEVPKAAFGNWRRTLAQRIGRYALVVDDLSFRADHGDLQVQLQWQNVERPFRLDDAGDALVLPGAAGEAAVCGADAYDRILPGGSAIQEWTGSVRKGEHRIFFSILGPKDARCIRLGDRAAALSLPEPALAVAGHWEGIRGDLVVVAADHLFGWAVTQVSLGQPFVASDHPVDIDWDFTTGELQWIADQPTMLELEGKAIPADAGRHDLRDRKPAKLERLRTELAALLDRARERRAARLAAPALVPPPAPHLPVLFTVQLGGRITGLIAIPASGSGCSHTAPASLAAAEGNRIHLLSGDGQPLRHMQTDGAIRVLRWWPEHQLLLAGCADEKVIAFDLDGSRQWTFVSEMDPAVFRAAKQYWFKSAPGHEGIHGIHTGVFLEGRSQAFVGSACTLEILDEHGRLVKRMPQFWGTVYQFAIVPGPAGSLNLLASRKITDGANVAVINNRTLDPNPRSFSGVPPGHSWIAGWMSETRHHIFHEDLDRDGRMEIVSEITGGWNRVSVWDEQGKPLRSASFGPGAQGARNIRDLDLGDLDGDGTKEIVAGLWDGHVVVLDSQCQRRWSRRLQSAPELLAVVGRSIVVGSEDGSVRMFDGQGAVLGQAQFPRRFTGLSSLGANSVLLATDAGELIRLQVIAPAGGTGGARSSTGLAKAP